MARVEDLACFICEEAPCICKKQGVTPKKAAPRKTTPPPVAAKPEPAAPEKPSFVERMRQQAKEKAGAAQESAVEDRWMKRTERAPTRFAGKMTDDEAALLSAVRALSNVFEIHPDDLAPFQDRLSRPPTVEEKAGAWRQKRNAKDTPA